MSNTPKTRWQERAHQRWPSARVLGDGMWVVWSKCQNPVQTVRLFQTKAAAETRLAALNKDKCCDYPPCQGAAMHSVWKIIL